MTKKVLHLWLELKGNKAWPNEYVGWYDEDFGEQSTISKTFEETFTGSYSKYWKQDAIKRAEKYAKPAECSAYFALFDPDYKTYDPLGKLEEFPLVIFLGKIEFEMPSPKPIIERPPPKDPNKETIVFYGEETEKNTDFIRRFGVEISSLEELTIFPNLKHITIEQDQKPIQINKISHLESFPNLISLFLTGNRISKLENLHSLSNLVEFGIQHAEIKKIENLENLITLEELYLTKNNIQKLEGLDNLTKLKKLILCYNKINKIENLDSLKNLEELDLSDNLIKKLEGFDELKNLKTLYIGYNQITKIEGLDNLKKLNKIVFNGNPIQKIEKINHLQNINEIRLNNCQIKKIENLSGLDNLTWLDIDENEIEKIENLENLPNLWHLDISENNISRLENIEVIKNLKGLYIWGNPIEEISRATYEAILHNDNINNFGLKEYEEVDIIRFVEKYDIKIID